MRCGCPYEIFAFKRASSAYPPGLLLFQIDIHGWMRSEIYSCFEKALARKTRCVLSLLFSSQHPIEKRAPHTLQDEKKIIREIRVKNFAFSDTPSMYSLFMQFPSLRPTSASSMLVIVGPNTIFYSGFFFFELCTTTLKCSFTRPMFFLFRSLLLAVTS